MSVASRVRWYVAPSFNPRGYEIVQIRSNAYGASMCDEVLCLETSISFGRVWWSDKSPIFGPSPFIGDVYLRSLQLGPFSYALYGFVYIRGIGDEISITVRYAPRREILIWRHTGYSTYGELHVYKPPFQVNMYTNGTQIGDNTAVLYRGQFVVFYEGEEMPEIDVERRAFRHSPLGTTPARDDEAKVTLFYNPEFGEGHTLYLGMPGLPLMYMSNIVSYPGVGLTQGISSPIVLNTFVSYALDSNNILRYMHMQKFAKHINSSNGSLCGEGSSAFMYMPHGEMVRATYFRYYGTKCYAYINYLVDFFMSLITYGNVPTADTTYVLLKDGTVFVNTIDEYDSFVYQNGWAFAKCFNDICEAVMPYIAFTDDELSPNLIEQIALKGLANDIDGVYWFVEPTANKRYALLYRIKQFSRSEFSADKFRDWVLAYGEPQVVRYTHLIDIPPYDFFTWFVEATPRDGGEVGLEAGQVGNEVVVSGYTSPKSHTVYAVLTDEQFRKITVMFAHPDGSGRFEFRFRFTTLPPGKYRAFVFALPETSSLS